MNNAVKYKGVIVDLDGTLYFQTPMRICMIFSILFFCITHFFKLREIFIVRDYRRLYTNSLSHLERCSHLAQKYNLSIGQIEHIIQNWMIKRPLPFVKKFRDKKLITQLDCLRKRGIKVIVYSDYPVIDKLEALGFMSDAAYSADDVGFLKPSLEGLLYILNENGLAVSDCLFIGDRYEKDGKCAENTGMDYFILPHCNIKRKRLYDMLGMWF